MKKLRFIFYYIKLRSSVMLGFHQTSYPLNLKWHWKFWKYQEKQRSGR